MGCGYRGADAAAPAVGLLSAGSYCTDLEAGMPLVADPLGLTVDGYAVGSAVGALFPLLLGIGLIAVGVRRRQATRPMPTWSYSGPATETAEPAAPSWTATPETEGPEAPAAAPAEPPGFPATEPPVSRGSGLIAAGVILLLLGLLAGGKRAADRTAVERTIELPSAVLGLARDDVASTEAGAELQGGSLPDGMKGARTAVYGMLPRAVLVLAAPGYTTRPGNEIEDFRRSFERDGGTLTDGKEVPAGPLGGVARCWRAREAAPDAVVCVFAETRSVIATTDFLGGGIDAAAARGLQIRSQTVRKRR